VLGAAFNAAFHPSGFLIRNRIIALSFTHENSFIPIYAKSDWSFRGEGNQQLAYWDDKGYVQPWIAPTPTQEEVAKIPKGPKADEDAKMDKDMMAFLGELEEEEPTDPSVPNFVPGAVGAVVAAAAPAAMPAKGSIAPISIKPIPTGPASSRAIAPPYAPKVLASTEGLSAGIVPAGPGGTAALGGKFSAFTFVLLVSS